jgi:hypothetical protein
MKRLLLALVPALLIAPASPAKADCHWEWDCSSGTCHQVQICKSPVDVSTPRTPSVRPVPPPTIRPLPSLRLPPPGTRQCSQRYLCNSMGQCHWQDVCR